MTSGILSKILPLTPLERVSPSRFPSLKECALREVWAAAGAPTPLPAAPAARLGSAIHRLLEEAGKRLFRDSGRPAIEKRWDELVGEAESAMRDSWLERHFVPLNAAVANYEVRKLKAIQRALGITESLPASPIPLGAQFPRGTEVWVSTPDGVAGGFIDQVEPSAAGPVLRDYKSGHILEETSGHGPGVVKEAYEVQLKLYAAIYASMAGVWPARLELIPLQGPIWEVDFTRPECQLLLRQAREAVGAINAIITNNSPDAAKAMLAAPSCIACRFCLFRPSCSAYRLTREREVAPEDGWPNDLWGTVRDKRVLGNGKLLLTIQPSTPGSPPATIRGLSSSPDRHPALPQLQQGDVAALFGLKGGGQGGTFQESTWTVIYRLEGGSAEK